MDIPTILCEHAAMRSDDPKIIVQLAPSLIAAVDDFIDRYVSKDRCPADDLLEELG